MGSIKHSPGRPCCGGDEPTAPTPCCLAAGGGFTNILILPASSILTPCTPPFSPPSPPWPYFGNLIVEVNGSTRVACNENGSYSLPNGPTFSSGSCQWRYQGPLFVTAGCPDGGFRVLTITIAVTQGTVAGAITSSGPGGSFPTFTFSRSFTTSDIPDFSEPYDIPYSGTPGILPWNAAVPLTVYAP